MEENTATVTKFAKCKRRRFLCFRTVCISRWTLRIRCIRGYVTCLHKFAYVAYIRKRRSIKVYGSVEATFRGSRCLADL